MGGLSNWAEKNAQYLKIGVGEEAFVRFLDYEEFIDHDNDDRPKIRYHFEVGGNDKIFESQSIALAQQMDKIKQGNWCKIKRTGEGRATRYEVTPVEPPGKGK